MGKNYFRKCNFKKLQLQIKFIFLSYKYEKLRRKSTRQQSTVQDGKRIARAEAAQAGCVDLQHSKLQQARVGAEKCAEQESKDLSRTVLEV